MLTEEELDELFEKHQLSDSARAAVRAIRRSGPSRNVRSNTHNVATHYASRKMGVVIKAEARSTELAAIYQWDHDRSTHEFYDQPPRIRKVYVHDNGRAQYADYTPDFFVLAEEFIGWVECKAEGWLIDQAKTISPRYYRDADGNWRCPAAEPYVKEMGLGFLVRSSAESDPIVIQNIADLSDYHHPDCPAATAQQLKSAQGLLGDAGWCWLRDLLTNEAGITADVVYKLIAEEQLHVDMREVPIVGEPHRVRVFRTRALMESSALWLPSLVALPLNGVRPVFMLPGTAIMWDGKASEILNVGDSKVYLRTPESPLVDLGIKAFETMVKTGQIIGTEEIADPRAALAAQRLNEASAEDLQNAMHRYYCVHPELCPGDEGHSACERAIRLWKAFARRGIADYGNEFVGLIPEVNKRGNRTRRLCDKTLDIVHEVIEEDVKSSSKKGQFVCWSLVVAKCRRAGLLPPSQKTFAQEIRLCSTHEDLKKAREGEKAGYNLELPFLSLERGTPKHGCRPFELAHVDHTLLDLQFVDESFGRNMQKAWLTVMIDAFTRMILAWVVLFDEPSYRSCMLVVRDCVRRHGRIPKTIVTDQGSDFKGKYFDQLLAFLGTHKRLRPASHPRFGNIVERFFGLNNTNFIHALRGNNQALQSPRSMSASHDPRRLAVWNLRAFRESFEGFLSKVYHATEHPALGVSPSKAMEIGMLQAGERNHLLIPWNRDFVIATMPSTGKGTARIQRDASFKAEYIDYFKPELQSFAGADLEVRYDPFDASRAYVLAGNKWIEGTSTNAQQLAGRSEKEIEAISLELRELLGRNGLRNKDRAALLGEFMESIKDREANLAIERQAARDREQRVAYAGTGMVDPVTDDPSSNVIDFPEEGTRQAARGSRESRIFDEAQRNEFGDF